LSESDRPTPAVSVVMVSYNSASIIESAIQPLAGHVDVEVIVVDNASSDGTTDLLARLFPDVSVLPMDVNLGFSKAVNIGVRASRGQNIMLLNPDAVVSLSVVRDLLEDLGKDGIGLVAPVLDNPTKMQSVVSAGYLPTLRRMAVHYSGLARLGKRLPALRGHYLYESQLGSGPMLVDWVTGACMVFRRQTWVEVHGLSERWFMYAEDIDFCRRITLTGRAVVLDTRLRATHLVGESDSTESFAVNPAWVVNTRDFYARELAPSQLHVLLWGITVGLGLFARSAVFAGRSMQGGQRRIASRTLAKKFAVYGLAALRSTPKGSPLVDATDAGAKPKP